LLMMPIMMFPLAVGEWGGEVETTETDDGIEVDIKTRVAFHLAPLHVST
jgi:hypothetical protein